MARVLTATLSPSGLDDDNLFVDLMNPVNGEGLCSFKLPAGTLADFEAILCDPQGPLAQGACRLVFYDQQGGVVELTRKCTSGVLTIKQGGVECWLHTFPDTGKFLEAMRFSRFDPSSANFDMQWTAKSTAAVSTQTAEQLVVEALGENLDLSSEAPSIFTQVFGPLVHMAEKFKMLNNLATEREPGIRKMKHRVIEHFLQEARNAATSMIGVEAAPVFLLKRAKDGQVNGASVIGKSYPQSFDRTFQNSLCQAGLSPTTRWEDVSWVLVSLDWNPQEGLASLKDLLEKKQQKPEDFAKLTEQEVCQMVHVQLRLSCCRFAEVQGHIHETCIQILAELLAYKLTILKFQPSLDLDAELVDFKVDAGHRGTLVLVTDISRDQMLAKPPQHRMILCYKAVEWTAWWGTPRQWERYIFLNSIRWTLEWLDTFSSCESKKGCGRFLKGLRLDSKTAELVQFTPSFAVVSTFHQAINRQVHHCGATLGADFHCRTARSHWWDLSQPPGPRWVLSDVQWRWLKNASFLDLKRF